MAPRKTSPKGKGKVTKSTPQARPDPDRTTHAVHQYGLRSANQNTASQTTVTNTGAVSQAFLPNPLQDPYQPIPQKAMGTNYAQPHMWQGLTGEQVVKVALGVTTLSRNPPWQDIAKMPAHRPLLVQDATAKDNLSRGANTQSVIAQLVGSRTTTACKSCLDGQGPWFGCVVLPGQMGGACANCHWNSSGKQCDFYGPNKPPKQPTSVPSQTQAQPGPAPPYRTRQYGGKSMPPSTSFPPYGQQQAQRPPLAPWQQYGQYPGPQPAALNQTQDAMIQRLASELASGERSLTLPQGNSQQRYALLPERLQTIAFNTAIYARMLQANIQGEQITDFERLQQRVTTQTQDLAQTLWNIQEFLKTPEGVAQKDRYEQACASNSFQTDLQGASQLFGSETFVSSGDPMQCDDTSESDAEPIQDTFPRGRGKSHPHAFTQPGNPGPFVPNTPSSFLDSETNIDAPQEPATPAAAEQNTSGDFDAYLPLTGGELFDDAWHE